MSLLASVYRGGSHGWGGAGGAEKGLVGETNQREAPWSPEAMVTADTWRGLRDPLFWALGGYNSVGLPTPHGRDSMSLSYRGGEVRAHGGGIAHWELSGLGRDWNPSLLVVSGLQEAHRAGLVGTPWARAPSTP